MNHQTIYSCHKQLDTLDEQILRLLMERAELIQAMAGIQRPNISGVFGGNQVTYIRQDLAANFGLDQKSVTSFKVLLMSMTLLIHSNSKPLALAVEKETILCT